MSAKLRIPSLGAVTRGSSRALQSTRGALALLALIAAALAVPAALGPVRLNDSFWIDNVWLEQFARELARGTLYPRWLPLSHAGLGSPVFYYYPPLAFYVGSLFVLAGFSTFSALVATFFIAEFLSGTGAYFWLKDQSDHPIVGAILLMIAPYHLFNFYQRGAIAEVLATAFLPFLLIGIRKISLKSADGFLCTVLAYAGLILSHLPLALLASAFLIAPYAAFSARLSRHGLALLAMALMNGLALAAIYLVPAFMLDQYRSSSDLWSLPYLQPANWSVWTRSCWSDKTYIAVLLMSSALSIPLVSLLVRQRSSWAMWALASAAIAAGVFPVLWSIPVLRLVQFPYRLLPITELAFVTAISLARSRNVPWIPMSVGLVAISASIITAVPQPIGFTPAQVRRYHPDVPENLPPGERPFSWPSTWALKIAAEHSSPRFDGKTTVEPAFYFPSWQVECSGEKVLTFPSRKERLLSYDGRGCTRAIVHTLPELYGALASLLALMALLVVSLPFRAVGLDVAPLHLGRTRPSSGAASP